MAREILVEAIKQFGSDLGVSSLDFILRQYNKQAYMSSSHQSSIDPNNRNPHVENMEKSNKKRGQVDKATKQYLRSLLMNYERTGGDLHQALDMELIKQRCLALAQIHYQKTLLAKGLYSFIRNHAETNGRIQT